MSKVRKIKAQRGGRWLRNHDVVDLTTSAVRSPIAAVPANGNSQLVAVSEHSPSELLVSAAGLIDRAVQQLDVQECSCGSCGRRDFTNRIHASAFEQIGPMPERLRAVAKRLAAT